MPKLKTYVDANVLISAFQGKNDISRRAMAVLDDPEREFVISDFLRLEAIPKPTFLKRLDEIAFMTGFFDNASASVETSPALMAQALQLACIYDLHPIDALHISAAYMADVTEFITSEKSTRPMFNVRELLVVSLRSPPAAIP